MYLSKLHRQDAESERCGDVGNKKCVAHYSVFRQIESKYFSKLPNKFAQIEIRIFVKITLIVGPGR